MSIKQRTLSDAGLVLTVLREYQSLPIEHPDKPLFAAALASLTAESIGHALHICSDNENTPFTLLVSAWNKASSPSAVLLSKAISDWDTAVAFWCVTNQNIFTERTCFADFENVDRFVMKATYELWMSTPKGSPVRWAEAARIYEDSELAREEGCWANHDASINWDNRLVNLTPKLLDILGYASIQEIDSNCLNQFPTDILQLVLIEAENHNSTINKKELVHYLHSCIAKPLPTQIPTIVLSNRGELSLAQALAFYLVDEKYGPKLTYATAASMLGMKNRQEIGTHLTRARSIMQKSGRNSILTISDYEEPFFEESPKTHKIQL